MKTFIYKILIFFVVFFVLYKITIGKTINEIESKVEFIKSKENIEYIKSKIKDEITNSLTKERYISIEDAQLINNFLNKIKKDLKVN